MDESSLKNNPQNLELSDQLINDLIAKTNQFDELFKSKKESDPNSDFLRMQRIIRERREQRQGETTPGATTLGETTPGAPTPGATTLGATTPGAPTPGATTLGKLL